MPKKEHEEPYFARLAEFMVREDKDIFVSATELELGLTSDECSKVSKNKTFQKLLRGERTKQYNELARDPQRSKDTLVGKAIFAIDKLLEAENYDKAMTGILSLAKIEGYVGNDTNVNVFSGLSTQDMEALRKRLKKDQDGPSPIPPAQGSA
jgi:hypothetical protein